eukprot:GGOE01000308.1.p1 GENE.GGOE01000308.1~~GGOE01000308.1.p1  ORF type:complete len:277 (+),score=61.23 GGOE01000308.1:35-865(+)
MFRPSRHRQLELLHRVEHRELSQHSLLLLQRLHVLEAAERGALEQPPVEIPLPPLTKEEQAAISQLAREWQLYCSFACRAPLHQPKPRPEHPCTQAFVDLPLDVLLHISSFCLAPDLGRLGLTCSALRQAAETPALWTRLLAHYQRQHPLQPATLGPPKDAVALSFFSTRVRVNRGLLFLSRRFTHVAQGPVAAGECITTDDLLDLVAHFFHLPPQYFQVRVFRRSRWQPVTVWVRAHILDLAMRAREVELCAICNTYYDMRRSECGHHAYHFPAF